MIAQAETIAIYLTREEARQLKEALRFIATPRLAGASLETINIIQSIRTTLNTIKGLTP